MAGVESNLTSTKLGRNTAQNNVGEVANDATMLSDDLADGNIPTTVIGTVIIEELITTFASENGTELGTEEVEVAHNPPWKIALIATFLSLIIILTIGGNVLVILSPIVSTRLRTVTYTFLVSLAIADFLLGITVLPWSAIYTISSEWPFSVIFCNIYISCDVMFCTSSILHLLVISLERYIAITRPYFYQRKMNHKKAWIAIVVVWTVSLGVSFLPIHLGWNTQDGSVQNYEDPSQCILTWNMGYGMFDGFVLFFIPLALMLLFYARIVMIAYQQAKSIQSTMVVPAPSMRGSSSQERHENANNNHKKNVVDEHKAVKIIAVVMGSFVICWVPYFTMFTFGPLFSWAINDTLYLIVLWLGYFNSLINPLVYACMNREFRRAFKTILSCARWNRQCTGSFGSHDSQMKQGYTKNHNARNNGSAVTYTTRDTLSTDTQSSVDSKRYSDLYVKLVKTQDDIAEVSEENKQSESISDSPQNNDEIQTSGPALNVDTDRYDSEQQNSPLALDESDNVAHLKEREPSSEQQSDDGPELLADLYISEDSECKQAETKQLDAEQEGSSTNRQRENPLTNGKDEEDPGYETINIKLDHEPHELSPVQTTTHQNGKLDCQSSTEKLAIISEDAPLLNQNANSDTIDCDTNDIKLKKIQAPHELVVDGRL